MEIDFAFHAVAGAIIGESGDIDLSDTTNSKLERIPLPHAVDMSPLKPFTRRLGFGLDPNQESVFLERAMHCSPGTGKLELVLDSSGSPCRIFPFEPNDTLLQ